MSAADLGLVVSVFFAAAVEFVEALTIVLAMGVTRGWRSAVAGTVSAVAALAVVAALAGYALAEWLPEALLQLVVGTLLLIFGLQWLRKAILRASGLKAHNDEDEVYREELVAGRSAGSERYLGLDWFGFVVSFKGVFLEGLEIVFIVITFGLNAGNVPLAATGIVAGRRATTHHLAIDDLRAAGAEVVEARFVDDGDIVSAGGVTSGLDLALHLVERFADAGIAGRVAAEIEYAP